MTALFYTCVAVLVAGLLLAGWTVFIERRRFRVRRIVLWAQALELPPLKILHLTDTHFHGRDELIMTFLARLARTADYDLVLWTGDLIDNERGIESAARAAALFHPTLGFFAVLGGHDYQSMDRVKAYTRILIGDPRDALAGDNPTDVLVARIEAEGVRVLKDEHAVLETGDGSRFAVVGLQDAFMTTPDFEGAWAGLPEQMPAIVIAHSPDVVQEVARRDAPLAFFGHTHGGQIRFPLAGALVTRSRLPGRLASGAFCHLRTVFVTGNGLGTSAALPYRFMCPPEAFVAELVPSADEVPLTRISEADLEPVGKA